MKARTHYLFSTGAGLYILSSLGALSVEWGLLVLWLSLAVNFFIDAAGHSPNQDGHPSRTRFTHSVFTAPAWGGLFGATSGYALFAPGLAGAESSQLALWAVAGALIALGHLFLDSLTQAGVYCCKQRIAIAHFSYNNFLLNAGFSLLGLILAFAAFFPVRLILPTQ